MNKLIQAMREQERLFYREHILSRSSEGTLKRTHKIKRNKAEIDLGVIYKLIMGTLV